nr:aldehyde dehydrogenase family protein [Saprospiraceae bacterium]
MMAQLHKIANYIGGQMLVPTSDQYLDNYEPGTGQPYSLIPDSDQGDVKQAVEAAKKAFPSWSSLSNEDRSAWLTKLADKIEEHLEEFAAAESKDNGKPISLARMMDIP